MKDKTINLNELSITELKAMMYDFTATIQQTEANMKAVNDIIGKKIEAEKLQITPTEEV